MKARPFADLEMLPPFGAILVDPPWHFETWSEKGRDRSAEKHYRTMTTTELAALPVRELAAQDSLMFMWTSGPMLPAAIGLLYAWGFSFSTIAFIWLKTSLEGNPAHGLGYWTRSSCELVLLGKRGSPKRLNKDVPQFVKSPRRIHSEKPIEVIKHIERLTPGPYLELFARRTRRGWVCWGDELDKLEAE